MKKIFVTFMVISVFAVTNTFAGWIHTTRGYTCDPATSEQGTCVWVDEYNQRGVTQPEDSESLIKSIETFISDYNPFDYFLN